MYVILIHYICPSLYKISNIDISKINTLLVATYMGSHFEKQLCNREQGMTNVYIFFNSVFSLKIDPKEITRD